MSESHYFVQYCICGCVYQDGKWIKLSDCKPFLLDLLATVEAVIFVKEICITCKKKA